MMAAKVVQVDLELKKAFQELQAKMIETKQKIKMADFQIEQLNHTKAHSKLTEAEISKLKPENRMFEGVGRMFIYADMETVKKRVNERYIKADEKIKSLENSKIFLEKSLKDSENNLREMIQQRKDKDEFLESNFREQWGKRGAQFRERLVEGQKKLVYKLGSNKKPKKRF